MPKQILLIVFVLFCAGFVYSVEPYTVILKNGRVMNGTLVSETADAIVFKDEKGFQFSLKKSSLDLEKMKEANAPKPEAEPVKQEEPAAKKEPRVYTAQDLEALREKYGELTTSELPEGGEEETSAPVTGDEYFNAIKGGASKLAKMAEGLSEVGEGIATTWEVATSTGKGHNEALKAYMAEDKASTVMGYVSSELGPLQSLRQSMTKVPKGYEQAYEIFSNAVDTVANFYDAVKDYQSAPTMSRFRSRIAQLSNRANSAVTQLQALKPVPAAKEAPKEKAASAEETPAVPEEVTEEAAPEEEL